MLEPVISINYIIDYVKYNKIDYVVLIARKGIRAFQLSDRVGEIQDKIVFFEAMVREFDRFEGKRILLFDEAVKTGDGFKRELDKIGELINKAIISSKHKKVTEKHIYKEPIFLTAAMYVHEECSEGEYPMIFPNENIFHAYEYDDYSSELMKLLISNGIPLDVDHPIGSFQFNEKFHIDDFIEEMEKHGKIYYLPYSGEINNVKLISLDFFCDPLNQILMKFNHLYKEGVMKIRLYIKKNRISVVPIVFPGIFLQNSHHKKNCSILKDRKEMSYCNVIHAKRLKKMQKQIMCRDCVIHNLNIFVLHWFISNIASKIGLRLISINEHDYRAMYFENGNYIQKVVWDELMSAYSHDLDLDIVNEMMLKSIKPFSSIDDIQLPMFAFEDFSSSYIVSQSIRAIERYHEMRNIPFIGTSLSLLIEVLKKELTYYEISMALDMLLDIGILKPDFLMLKPDDVNLNLDVEGVIFIRVYRTAGEDVKTLLDAMKSLTAIHVEGVV